MGEIKKFGYIRVSSKDQNEARQVENMRKEGIEERDIIIEKQSGKNFERPKYQALKQMARKGDTIVFDSITRMGRNMKETTKEYEELVERGINLIFLKEPMLNTDNEKGDVMKEAIQKIILTVLTAFAEKERVDIKIRQAEGIEAAMKSGKKFGRPQIELPANFEAVYDDWKGGHITAVQAMKDTSLTRATFYRLVKKYEAGEIE